MHFSSIQALQGLRRNSSTRLETQVFPERDEPWIHRSSQRAACVEGCRIAGVTIVRAIFGHLRTDRKCQVRDLQHVVNTPRKTFPLRKLQLSPTSSHRDQSSTGGVHGPSLLASALAKNGGALHDAARLVPLRWIVRVEQDLL